MTAQITSSALRWSAAHVDGSETGTATTIRAGPPPERGHGGPHGRARRQAVVDEDHGAAADVDRRSRAAVQALAALIKESGSTRRKAELEWQFTHLYMLEAAGYPFHVEGRVLPAVVSGKESRVYRGPAGVVGVKHQPSAEDENRYIREHGMGEYGKWFLAIDTEEGEDTKGRYKFPYGDFEAVHRCGVLTAESRAGQYQYQDIELAAAHLHGMLDGAAEQLVGEAIIGRRDEVFLVSRVRRPGAPVTIVPPRRRRRGAALGRPFYAAFPRLPWGSMMYFFGSPRSNN